VEEMVFLTLNIRIAIPNFPFDIAKADWQCR